MITTNEPNKNILAQNASAAQGVLASQQMEVGRLYAERGDFELAVPKLTSAAEMFLQTREFESYLECQNQLLRIFAEQEQVDAIHAIKEKIQDLVLKEGLELNAKTFYTLALCTAFRGNHEAALEYLQKALAIALASDNKKDICYAINGIAICYKNMNRLTDALKELYNLQVFFQVLELPEIKISSQILNAQILNELKKHDQALEILWSTYDLLKTHKILNLHLSVLYNLGKTFMLMGDKDTARTYFKLCGHSVDPKNMVRLARGVQDMLNQLGGESAANYDLIFETDDHSIIEKKLGRVDFKNQFILMDLLRLFVQNQGQVYSKEYLVEQVWKQNYDPQTHDNKIYVTIKRLRKMIEPDYDKPKYIFRAKNGYFMNKSARVLIEKKGDLQ